MTYKFSGLGLLLCLLPSKGDLRRHNPLPLGNESTFGAKAIAPSAVALVPLQGRDDAMIATPKNILKHSDLPKNCELLACVRKCQKPIRKFSAIFGRTFDKFFICHHRLFFLPWKLSSNAIIPLFLYCNHCCYVH